MATTLTQLRTNVSAILGLDNATTGDQPQIDFYANEAVRKVLIETRCYITSTTVTPGATDDYAIGATILEIVDAFFTSGGSRYVLEPLSIDELLQLRRSSPSTSGPARYYHVAGNTAMMFYPTPGATDTLTLYYVPLPTEATTGANDFATSTYGPIPASMFDCIEFYALWRLADLDDDASSEQGERYRQLYELSIAKARKHLRDRGGYRLSAARVRPRKYFPRDPSASPANY